MSTKEEKHILALSGGKDSAALAVYMREQYPHIPLEYVFIDSGCELPETYEYLSKIRALLNIKITQIGGVNKQDRRDFEWWLKHKNYYLPSQKNRWCTEVLKLIPYSKWLENNYGNYLVHSYVGLRADEKRDRTGYLGNDDQLISHHPFVEDGLVYEDIRYLLDNSSLGLPSYYKWRSRSGCYFCFFQTKREWLGLLKHHELLFYKAAAMEKIDPKTGKQFTWCDDMSLHDIVANRGQIEKNPLAFEHGKERKPKLMESLRKCYENASINIVQQGNGGNSNDT